MWKKNLLIAVLFSVSLTIIYGQEFILNHTSGPMGGIVGDIGINSKGEIYAGVYSTIISYSGLYKSIDNGNSWKKVKTQFDDFEVYAIYITDEDHIWVGTNFQGRIYLSTDNGETWENKRNGYNTGECWAFGQSKDGVLFAGDGQYVQLFRSTDYGDNWEFSANLRPLVFATDSNNTVYAGTHDGLFGTTDNGITWAQNNFLKDIPVAIILIDDENNIFCGTGYYDNGNGVYLSTDDGASWQHLGLDSMVVLSLEFDSKGNLYAGTKDNGLFKTNDMGQTWTQHTKGLYRKQVFRLEINSKDDIFVGSEMEGVFRSTNNGEIFEQVGLPTANAKDIKFYGDSLMFASTPSGVQKYDILTNKWTNIGLHDVYGVDITESGIIYAATFADGLYRSTDLGKNWLRTNLTKDTLMSVYNVLAIDDDTVFAATEFNLRKTTDGGNTWTILPVNTNFFSRGMFLNNRELWVTGYGISNYNLYHSINYLLFDSTYSGLYWSENNCISALETGKIFITDPFNGTFRSTDNGQSWSEILPNKHVWTIYSENNGLVLGGARDTIWYSDDFGDNFIGVQVPFKRENNITDIKRRNNDQLYFSTYSTGIFELDISTNVNENEKVVLNYALYQNYPNPFNPSTTIKYSLPKRGLVQLKIYDVLGREVASLVNKEQTSGNYQVEFNANNLSSGIYFYRLQSGGFMETKKLILIR